MPFTKNSCSTYVSFEKEEKREEKIKLKKQGEKKLTQKQINSKLKLEMNKKEKKSSCTYVSFENWLKCHTQLHKHLPFSENSCSTYVSFKNIPKTSLF